jgi:hypothetical protein
MEIDTTLLPPVAQRLVEHLGLDQALAVIRAYARLPLYVPHAPTAELAAAVGESAAAALCREFGGESFRHIPACEPALLAERNRAIVRAVAEGVPKTELVRQHGICWQQVHNIARGRRNGRPQANDQRPEHPDLFD